MHTICVQHLISGINPEHMGDRRDSDKRRFSFDVEKSLGTGSLDTPWRPCLDDQAEDKNATSWAMMVNNSYDVKVVEKKRKLMSDRAALDEL